MLKSISAAALPTQSVKINLSSSGDTVLDYFQRWPQSKGYRVLSLGDLEHLVLFKSKDVMKVTQQYSGEAGERDDCKSMKKLRTAEVGGVFK